MIDLFAIFGKGGIVLWCFQGTQQLFTPSINTLIREVFLQERGNVSSFSHKNVTMQFKLDNEFELIFLVVYQSVIQLSYVDKLLSDVHREFRDQYKNVLENRSSLYSLCGTDYFDEFETSFKSIYNSIQDTTKNLPQKSMRTFEESIKSQKTVESMIVKSASGKPGGKNSQIPVKEKQSAAGGKSTPTTPTIIQSPPQEERAPSPDTTNTNNNNLQSTNGDSANDDEILRKRKEFMEKQQKGKTIKAPTASPKPEEKGKKKPTKKMTTWEGSVSKAEAEKLDFSAAKSANDGKENSPSAMNQEELKFVNDQKQFVGKSQNLDDVDYRSSDDEDEDEEDEIETTGGDGNHKKPSAKPAAAGGGGSRFGIFSAFKSLVGSKKLTEDDLRPGLDKMKDHLIAKNVAADIADKLCQSVATKLTGKVIGTFSGVTNSIKETLRESLVQILSPNRRVDILRDILEAKRQRRPFTIAFCGVNGVGKSTNLAKITFWLNENGHKVLIAACDTFRAGAVEQLRTHTRHLNALHPNSVQLYEQGYGKDAAAVAAQAISYATECGIDVVLIDTAGRMQDNEPLMRALAKLIRVNMPDLVLFVGEALVGNEAVDQLTKFNQALADHAGVDNQARLIDGILLTKFDTIDDKVGAAISMTYITGQPIVFVGTGQTYRDLKNLNANAVVHSLLK